ncbi:hypothetical protein [Cerasicoccus arenae]|uniref:hypothetical protein n=1 Tax=Cerasicoccus arenae TaxID=424488 RepID=UPI0016730DF0
MSEIILSCWYFYDDCKDHLINVQKPEWDYLQRSLLILHSDAEFATDFEEHKYDWSWLHTIALIASISFIGTGLFLGWGWHLLLVAVPFGAISMFIAQYRSQNRTAFYHNNPACYPFSDVAQIRLLYRQIKCFKKRPYRSEIAQRTIRTDCERRLMLIPAYFTWLISGPLVLLFQGLPSSQSAPATLIISK